MAIREFGYEYDAKLNKALFDKTFHLNATKMFNGAYCLRSGRDALKAVAREYKDAVVLVPSLACSSMFLPFQMYGHKVVFYKLNQNLEIEKDSFYALLKENSKKTVLFLYMDYFGIKSIQDSELKNVKESFKNIVFINDITHVFLTFNQSSCFKADYVVASIRKWANIPDGGLLWCNKKLKDKTFACDTSFAYKRLEAQQLRHSFLETGNLELKNEFRRIFSEVSNILDSSKNPSLMSKYSYELFKGMNFKEIFAQRKRNAEVLVEILKTSKKINILQKKLSLSYLYVPFMIKNRDLKQQELSRAGIFNTIIWPLSEMQMNTCNISKQIANEMLAAPCDQRYTADDMRYIGQEMVKIINE